MFLDCGYPIPTGITVEEIVQHPYRYSEAGLAPSVRIIVGKCREAEHFGFPIFARVPLPR